MDRVLNIGDEVLVFKYISEWGINQDYFNFKRGKVLEKELSKDLAYHGSSWNVLCYKVIGDDGRIYFGNYGRPIIHDSFFMVGEDYINYLNRMINKNLEKIQMIDKENKKIQNIIDSFDNNKVYKKK